ncbi:MAG: hypothetical protein HRT58_06200 [Crocinitomicaceae bacterium]|nr:hypothetical protein [Flavobacteriales bacterium]NQZ35235.1 hypothetical protein [Crocinitomicaceae bacterium]
MDVPFGLILFFYLLVIARPLTTLLHELGHAIPALLITKSDVLVYVGSFGDRKGSLNIKLGRLIIYLKYNIFLWFRGVCIPMEKMIPFKKQMLFVVAGPFVSLTIALISVYMIISIKPNINGLAFLLSFTISALIDFLINIIPSEKKIILENGDEIGNDGAQLKSLFSRRKVLTIIENANTKYTNQEYRKALALYQESLDHLPNNKGVHRLIISCAVQLKDNSVAAKYNEDFFEKFEQNSMDFLHSGLIKSYSGNHIEAILDFDQSILLDNNNAYALNNRGYSRNCLNLYSEAIVDFNSSLSIDENFAFAYNNRGFSKIKLGSYEDGYLDIKISLDLDNNNSYAYKNLGIYYLEKGDFVEAKENFIRSKDIDATTDEIDALLEEAISKI